MGVYELLLAALAAYRGWALGRRLRGGAAGLALPGVSPRMARLVAAAALICALPGLLSFVYCQSLYNDEEMQGFFNADDATLVAALALLALPGLFGAACLSPLRSPLLVPVMVLGLLVGRQAWGAGMDGECWSLRGVLHGGDWVLRADW